MRMKLNSILFSNTEHTISLVYVLSSPAKYKVVPSFASVSSLVIEVSIRRKCSSFFVWDFDGVESINNRQITYAKRKLGILKKANELSILCDIDIVLLMFSSPGKPTIFHGERSCIEEVISKFAQSNPRERTKRKLETLEGLKKTFKKLDHDVNINEFLGEVEEVIASSRVFT